MALALNLRLGEAIQIGDDVIVKYATKGQAGEIKLAIDAPKDLKIIRLGSVTWEGRWRVGKKIRVYIPGEDEGNK